MSTEYRWSNEQHAHGMPTLEDLERDGYERVCPHPNYPASWLMRREVLNG